MPVIMPFSVDEIVGSHREHPLPPPPLPIHRLDDDEPHVQIIHALQRISQQLCAMHQVLEELSTSIIASGPGRGQNRGTDAT